MSVSSILPQVTIGITTYDRFDLLIETIDSVRNQTFVDFKVIIANDNPERNLDTKSLGISDDSRFSVINHVSNLGEIRTLNYLLSLADTEYFTWLSDDDIIHPFFLEAAVKGLNCNSEAVAFYSSYSSGSNWQPQVLEVQSTLRLQVFDTSTFLSAYSARKIRLIGCYGLFRRTAVVVAGGLHQLGSGFAPYADTLLPILIAVQGKIIYTDAKYIFLRIHKGSLSSSSRDLKSYVSAQKDFISIISPLLLEIMEYQRKNIRRDFFDWFSDDRAAILQRNPGIIAPLLLQIAYDKIFLLHSEIAFPTKLRLLPSLFRRFLMTFRTLLKARVVGISS